MVGLGQTGAEVTPQVSRAMRGLQTDPEGTGGLAGSAQALCLSPACLEKWVLFFFFLNKNIGSLLHPKKIWISVLTPSDCETLANP